MVDLSPDCHDAVIIQTSDWLSGHIEPALESFTWNVMKMTLMSTPDVLNGVPVLALLSALVSE